MSKSLQGAICVVTGGSVGIGHAIAENFAQAGARVLALARRFSDTTVRVPPPGSVAQVQLDVTDEVAVKQLFAGLDRLDVLVNNAGTGVFDSVLEAQAEDIRGMLEVHILGTFLCSQHAIGVMRKTGAGHIVNVCSVAATQTFPHSAGYTAAKSGQLGLTRVLREEVREHNIRVSALLPGATDTEIWDGRPGFDRSKMIKPTSLASLVLDVVTKPELSVEELVVLPPSGNL